MSSININVIIFLTAVIYRRSALAEYITRIINNTRLKTSVGFCSPLDAETSVGHVRPSARDVSDDRRLSTARTKNRVRVLSVARSFLSVSQHPAYIISTDSYVSSVCTRLHCYYFLYTRVHVYAAEYTARYTVNFVGAV